MIAGPVHFALLLASLVVAVAASIRSFARPSGLRILAASSAAVWVLLALALSVHNCDAGLPLMQWLVPAVGYVLALLFVGRAWWRRALCVANVVLMLALGFHYSDVVHGPYCSGHAEARPHSATFGEPEWHSWLTGLYRRAALSPDGQPPTH